MTVLSPFSFDPGLLMDLAAITVTFAYLVRLVSSTQRSGGGGRLSLGERLIQLCITPKRSLLRQQIVARRLAS